MKFDKVQFVYVDIDYLEYLHNIDSEIFFDKSDSNYRLKPHLGILLNNHGREYVIPLTSAKDKHKSWEDVSASWYRIYEVIDITDTPIGAKDVIVEIKNQEIIKKLDHTKSGNYRQRILSVLDMRKMFPVNPKLYKEVKFNVNSRTTKSDAQRNFLMLKEYHFIRNIANEIEIKATKIYNKQIEKGKVLKYHCNYKKLEEALEQYIM